MRLVVLGSWEKGRVSLWKALKCMQASVATISASKCRNLGITLRAPAFAGQGKEKAEPLLG